MSKCYYDNFNKLSTRYAHEYSCVWRQMNALRTFNMTQISNKLFPPDYTRSNQINSNDVFYEFLVLNSLSEISMDQNSFGNNAICNMIRIFIINQFSIFIFVSKIKLLLCPINQACPRYDFNDKPNHLTGAKNVNEKYP